MSNRMICPFNEKHVVTADRFITHVINKCTEYQKKKHQYTQCQYDSLHFVKKSIVKIHQQNCQSRPPDRISYKEKPIQDFKPRQRQDFVPVNPPRKKEPDHFGDPASLNHHRVVYYKATKQKQFKRFPDALDCFDEREKKNQIEQEVDKKDQSDFDKLFNWPDIYMKELQRYKK